MDEVGRAYGARSQEYIDLFGGSTGMRADDLDLIARHLASRSGVVLDVGCGPGHLTDHLRSLGVEATGLDLVPEFIEHARATYPDGRYEIASMHRLPVPDGSMTGILAWYSLIHVAPDDLDGVLAELRRVSARGGSLVAGFFDAHDDRDDVSAFDHQVIRAYAWPADEFAERIRRAGFSEVERVRRPGVAQPGRRPHAVIAAVAD